MITNTHTFHIPVLGTGFSADTPLKVAHLGIDSVISLSDDTLLEKLRKLYAQKYRLPFSGITDKTPDARAKRITSYLDLLNELVEKKTKELCEAGTEKRKEIREYFSMLPDSSSLKQEFKELSDKYLNIPEIRAWLKENLKIGSIDVNIMTKLDKTNYAHGKALPQEYNDAHAAVRGYAESNVQSSIVFSAGMNPRLYSYLENFDDFYPDTDGHIKKKIALKVSDYRSAFIQGRFLAKKGLWVSEYRVESGLNCGGHAFASAGQLMGPILADFRDKRKALQEAAYSTLAEALAKKGRPVPAGPLPVKITAQGGVGTAEEQRFLTETYKLDSVGWGTPFMLVPEVVNVDDQTLEALEAAQEDDLYLSSISPLGVPFNNIRNSPKDVEKQALADSGKAGSACPKHFLVSTTEYTDKPLCTASRQYQKQKLDELEAQHLPAAEYQRQRKAITDRACLCTGLAASTLLVNKLDTKTNGAAVSVCPGPNLAYFNTRMSLTNITDHIYGRANFMPRKDRPHVFIKELQLYMDYLLAQLNDDAAQEQDKYYSNFIKNLKSGITYYINLFSEMKGFFADARLHILEELEHNKRELSGLYTRLKTPNPKPLAPY